MNTDFELFCPKAAGLQGRLSTPSPSIPIVSIAVLAALAPPFFCLTVRSTIVCVVVTFKVFLILSCFCFTLSNCLLVELKLLLSALTLTVAPLPISFMSAFISLVALSYPSFVFIPN